jgi:hypothetical protein
MNYVQDLADIELSFRNIFEALKAGGYLLIDLMNFLAIIKRYKHPEPQKYHYNDKVLVSNVHHEINVIKSIWTHRSLIFIQEGEQFNLIEDIHRLAMITKRELQIFANQVGLEFVNFFSSYSDREDEFHNGARLILLYKKPE